MKGITKIFSLLFGGGEDERDEVDDVLGEDKGNERRRKGNGWNEDG